MQRSCREQLVLTRVDSKKMVCGTARKEIHWDVLRFCEETKQMLRLQTVETGVETQ